MTRPLLTLVVLLTLDLPAAAILASPGATRAAIALLAVVLVVRYEFWPVFARYERRG